MSALPLEILEERYQESELGRLWAKDPMMQQDVWPLTDLGYSKDKYSKYNFYFNRITLPWLKYLAKLTVKEKVRKQKSKGSIWNDITSFNKLNDFLVSQGYIQPMSISDALLRAFISAGTESSSEHRYRTLAYATRLWAEEGWLSLPFIPMRREKSKPKLKTIPEEVLHQIYEQLDLFPAPLERLFRLQLSLGCRISELLELPRQCLKQEGKQWFLLRWVAKRKHWRYYQIHPLVAELVREQQRFLTIQFGKHSSFNKLFCKTSAAGCAGAKQGERFQKEPVYIPIPLPINMACHWIKCFREVADLRDKNGNPFILTSHMFRRTKASVMAYCEVEDEYIAAILGHGSLDMLPHYRKRSLERLEKDAHLKTYVDMYGRATVQKPRKQRYEKLAELLKVSTPLGECHRPTMLGDCQYRYACLSCTYHRVTEADRSQLIVDQQQLMIDLEQAAMRGQQRRITEIQRLLELVSNRLQGLDESQALAKEKSNG